MTSRRPLLLVTALVVAFLARPQAGEAQVSSQLRIRHAGGEVTLSVATSRGFAALPIAGVRGLGWGVERTALGLLLTAPDGTRIGVRDGTPVVSWGSARVQLADAPYFEGGDLFVPLQLLTDVVPGRLGEGYRFEPAGPALTWGDGRAGPGADSPARPLVPSVLLAPLVRDAKPTSPAGRPLVIIDAGHGGRDPGTIGRGGVREKDVALGIARALAGALRESGKVDVVLIRDSDTFVPVWDRGALGTKAKGERPGVYVSIHANSFNNDARGFETYFLSEARTEHERRVAAIENAPLGVEATPGPGGDDLDFILRELKNLDQQHWSSLLAEMVQAEVARIHPGPDRGVKQGPLAVLTNAIMPSVLVEIGYLSHPEEARLLSQAGFQRDAGVALARAVERFFQRYPPGAGSGAGEGR